MPDMRGHDYILEYQVLDTQLCCSHYMSLDPILHSIYVWCTFFATHCIHVYARTHSHKPASHPQLITDNQGQNSNPMWLYMKLVFFFFVSDVQQKYMCY